MTQVSVPRHQMPLSVLFVRDCASVNVSDHCPGLSRGVFTLDFSPDAEGPKKIAVAGGDASIRIIDIIEGEGTDDVVVS